MRIRAIIAVTALAVLLFALAISMEWITIPGLSPTLPPSLTPTPPSAAATTASGGSGAAAKPGTPTPFPLVPRGTRVPPLLTEVLISGGSQDLAKLTPLLRYQTIACAANPPQGAGGPPKCAPGEADGATADYMQVAGCEGAWLRPAQVPAALQAALGRAHTAYAAAAVTHDQNWPAAVAEGKYVVVFQPTDPATLDTLAVYLDDTGIVRLTIGCARPDQRVRVGGTGAAFDFYVAPRQPFPAN
jgi:hypothetical protein